MCSDADYEPLDEEGQVSTVSTTSCHNITIVDDDLVESPEDLQVNLRNVFNVAGVQQTPNVARVIVKDTDGKSTYSLGAGFSHTPTTTLYSCSSWF